MEQIGNFISNPFRSKDRITMLIDGLDSYCRRTERPEQPYDLRFSTPGQLKDAAKSKIGADIALIKKHRDWIREVELVEAQNQTMLRQLILAVYSRSEGRDSEIKMLVRFLYEEWCVDQDDLEQWRISTNRVKWIRDHANGVGGPSIWMRDPSRLREDI